MTRQYTQRPFMGQQITAAEDYNGEIRSAVSEFNGDLDQNNMPLQSVARATMAAPRIVVPYQNASPGMTGHFIKSVYQQSQSYHNSYFCGLDGNGAFQVTSISQDEWRLGWIKLNLFRFETTGGGVEVFPGSALSFDAKEGMVMGEAEIDTDWRISFVLRDVADPNIADRIYIYEDYFIEWGVFVNDVCCGRTDEQWGGGRFTYVLPYSTPVGTGPCNVDIRFRIIWKNGAYPSGTVTEIVKTPLLIHDSMLWTKNQYR